MKFRTTHYHTHTLTLDDGAEINLTHEPAGLYRHEDMLIERVGDKLVVAYLVHDDNCENPLESCDGMGEIVGRGRYATRHAKRGESDVLKAMGLNQDGDPDYELEPVERRVNEMFQQHLRDMDSDSWSEIFDVLYGPPGLDDYSQQQAAEELSQIRAAALEHTLSECGNDEAEVIYQALSGLGVDFSYSDFPHARIRTAISFDVDAAQEMAWQRAEVAGEIGDPDAVLLDVYDHGGLAWSIHGGGMQCRWDTSQGAGMWFPDKCLLDELISCPSFAERRAKAIEFAEQAVDLYNEWLSGECYGCVVETFELRNPNCDDPTEQVWDQVDEDSCWGYVGGEHALDALRDEFYDRVVANLKQDLLAGASE